MRKDNLALLKSLKKNANVILHRHSPEGFDARRTRRFERLYATAEARDRYREEFNASCPGTHRYNGIAGFAEVYWDAATRILVDYYFRGLRNTRFGKAVVAHWGEGVRGEGFYPIPYIELGSIPHPECNGAMKRQAIRDALDELARRTAEDFGCCWTCSTLPVCWCSRIAANLHTQAPPFRS